MSKIFLLFAICAAAPFIVTGQTENVPLYCNETVSMAFDPVQFSGIWFEVARGPAISTGFLCTQVNFTQQDNDVMGIRTTFSDTPLFPWVNATMIASVTIDSENPNPYGYNFTYAYGHTTTPITTYKLLETDYSNYAFICGYTNVTNNATYFNIVLTRDRMPSSTVLNGYETLAAQNYVGFDNSSLTLVTQGVTCYNSTSTDLVPVVMTLFYGTLALYLTA